MHFPTSFYSISSRAPSSLLVLIFEKRYETIEDLCSGERLETTKKKKKRLKEAVLHLLMSLLKPWWSVLTAGKNTYRIIKIKILRHLFHQRINLTKTCLFMALFLITAKTPIWKVKAKRLQIIIVRFNGQKIYGDVLLKRWP